VGHFAGRRLELAELTGLLSEHVQDPALVLAPAQAEWSISGKRVDAPGAQSATIRTVRSRSSRG
jgi:hypothetical protein